ncbi:bifunctional heptose 7-phosphate kinase/heptose 1-phosphate adenyltransferase [Candidatus Kinetoplastibacterium sorsogonicusi]|uniref:bifunctional heptose 7-phosphate kinase/heptose 1-phosphate adenyltransferase n=1 Tax=Candidatus Kinetoplastidibacterium kentomonadis TaxID=1576550 RepID=UPI000D3E9EA7|nr:PfkB family carbohydrate kinase [Candidatus Kinetoplastibacterium sorsogonicusi]
MIFPINDIKKHKVLIVGDIILDTYWFVKNHKLSYEAMPIHVASKEDQLGGAGNIAKNITLLGAFTTLIGICGDDESGKLINSLLKKYNICSKIIFEKNNITTLQMKILDKIHQLLSVDFENMPDKKSINKLYKIFIKEVQNHDIVIFSDHNKGSLIQIDKMISFAETLKIPILVDPIDILSKKYTEANFLTFDKLEIKK